MILCTRNYQNSITDSVHKLLSLLIYEYKLDKYFTITKTSITCYNGSEFIFKGLERSINEIKSLEGITICWVEEATKVTKNSYDILVPTIRQEGSEIWISFNPDEKNDFTFKYFVTNPRPRSKVVLSTYYDYDLLPQTLIDEANDAKENHPDVYDHVWLGNCKKRNDAQILKDKWEEAVFPTPDISEIYNNRFYRGLDWGFSVDPTVLLSMFIKEDGIHKDLYIEHEAYAVGVETNQLSAFLCGHVPGARDWKIIADNARPEQISYLAQPYDQVRDEKGFHIEATTKWKGSVESGIGHLRSYRKIYIHSRCKNTLFEAQYYHYIVNNAGEIQSKPKDKHNHCWDAARYGVNDLIVLENFSEPKYEESDNNTNYDLNW